MSSQPTDINSIRPWRTIERRKSRKIHVGTVESAATRPIAVQSMTNTLTHDVDATVGQVLALQEAGADIVRVSVPDPDSAAALRSIVDQVQVPLVADIHFHYKRGIEAAENGAACLRINPGNIGGQSPGQRSRRRRARQWLLHSYRRQWRLAGTRTAGKIWRALPRRDGRERAHARPHAR